MESNIYAERLDALRALMERKGWDAVVLTGSDPHASEYPAERWKQVEWLTGFTGEAGDVVVTANHAGLWTDTRYFIQAGRQLAGTGFTLHKTRVPGQVLIPDWLAQTFGDETMRGGEAAIAIDGLCMSVSAVAEIKKALVAARIVSVPDLLDELREHRPAIPANPVSILDSSLMGESVRQHIERIREYLEKTSRDAILLTSLDEIAWTLNVRGSDIEYNPYVISYLEITPRTVKWFVRKKIYTLDDDRTLESFEALEQEGIQILPYEDIEVSLVQDISDGEVGCLQADAATLNYHLSTIIEPENIEYFTSPVQLWKAVKNKTQTEGMKDAHIVDGVAMEKFIYWLESEVRRREKEGEKGVSEWEAACRLGKFRAESPDYVGDSFETISAYSSGAALPHYVTPKDLENGPLSPILQSRGLYLNDSGGQYLYGTTDITRTIPLGACSMLEKEDYTLVLKGHIDLAKAVFPAGTAGCQIDALAREPLWQARRSFGHGTGHGVGFYLGVHEGPQDIRQNFNPQPLLPGMISSNEPGIYREGMHGVRHENLILCVEDESNEFGDFLRFETITLCHFDTSAIIADLLDRSEIEWLNAYNERVYQTLSPLLPAEISCWLRGKTLPI